ncbi:MAG: hypothetical protein SGARI_001619, partial [Bacillariaceae sp.]
MRKSKSNPAKYARNYRKISQRRMTQYDDVDEEQEMERLRKVLRNSERQLKQVEEPEDLGKGKKRKRKSGSSNDAGYDTTTDASAAILSKELSSELGCEYNVAGEENPLVVLSSKKKKKDKKAAVQLSPEEIREAKLMQKKTAKKLQQLETRAAQKKKRAELYKRLEESQK